MPPSPGVDDGATVAREPNLEVQLGFAGTLVATATAIVWSVLGGLADTGLASVGALFGTVSALVVLQLYVVDHSWFLVQRGAWLGAVLLGRQDRRNQDDPGFVAGLEALYDAGSVRFYLGFANVLVGARALAVLVGLALLQGDLATGAPVLGAALALPGLVWMVDRALTGRWPVWTDRVHPMLGVLPARLGVPWVAMPFGRAHRRGCLAWAGRLFLALVLLTVDLAWIFIARLEPDRELVHLSDGEPVVLRLRVGGVSPAAVPATLELQSDTVPADVLAGGVHWFADRAVVVIPVDALTPGAHTVAVKQLRLGGEGFTVTVGTGRPAEFVVVP